jgi:putative acetyltransferase
MELRRATAGDLVAIAAIHRASIGLLCAVAYSREQVEEWLSALRPEAYAGLLAHHELYLVEDGMGPRGFGVYDATSAFIHATYVAPAEVGHGVGRMLMAAMENSASANGAREVNLHATLNAVGFYEKRGYVRSGVTANRLPSGIELPCFAMAKALSGSSPSGTEPGAAQRSLSR